MIKRFFVPKYTDNFISVGLLLLRVVVGLAFMLHGWSKIQTPMGWMPEGSPVPGILQALAAISEFGGGLAWIIGLLTPLAGIGIFFTMAVAFLFHFTSGDPFVGSGGASYELALVYLAISVMIISGRAGKFSLDYLIFKK